ncbi:MAG: FAD-dependent oxidoreductase, partial [Mesosutterella sp.]|nr:FAD-dependent oxidoreductase [Mesosutterella sp.]
MTTFKKSVLIAALLAAAGTASAAVSYTPGTYTGEANGRNGPVKVEVQVDSSKILSVKVVSHHESKGLSDQPLAVIPKQIVEKQSLAVDGFSGATFSSRAVINATKAALSKASKDISPLLVAPVVAKAALPSKRSCDVVVIGSGVAGLSAGIEAKEHGADVVILEKQGLLGAGDSMNISTGVSAGGSRMISDLGIKNASAKDFENFLLKQAADKKIPINKDNVITYARRSGETIDWLMNMGVPFGRFQ